MDFDKLRALMVEEQMRDRGISDARVLRAFLNVPRHEFVRVEDIEFAYDDMPVPIGEGQTISQPYMVAAMTECLALKGGEKVLEVGTGSGYQAAILAGLCRWVYSVERIEPLGERAKNLLSRLNINNCTVIIGDGTEGLKDNAPYDCIIVTAAAPKIPEELINELVEGGRLVIPLGNRFIQTLSVITRRGDRYDLEERGGCMFVPLIGKDGWAS